MKDSNTGYPGREAVAVNSKLGWRRERNQGDLVYTYISVKKETIFTSKRNIFR